MSDDVMRAIGRIEGRLEGMDTTLNDVHSKIDGVQSHGCSIGRSNSERIDALEGRPRRIAWVGGGSAAGGLGVGAGLVYILKWLFAVHSTGGGGA